MSNYRAFISYSHSDQPFAIRLQRALENYRVPSQISERLELESNRLTPIFRDTSDLAAAPGLTDALKEALRDSAALIVICSPTVAGSSWVDQEIETFRREHGSQALILPIIASNSPDGPVEDLFPSDLAEAVPLAADARPKSEGFRLAILKLAAGLLGVGLDELVQREAKRRYRRMLVGSATSLAVAIAMGVLALQAMSARDDAQRRLSQSEDLIGFMLGDLRAQLTPLGQVKVLESVGEKALAYFASLEAEDQTDASRLRQSKALYQIGDVYFELGQFNLARQSFQLSLNQARRLAAESPDDLDRLFELSQAEFWVAFAAWYGGDLTLAETHFQNYHDAAWSLHQREPENPDWIMETFWADNNMGSLVFRNRKYAQARGLFEDATARIDLLIDQESTPERRLEKSATLSWLGSTHYRLGELQQSRLAFELALAMDLDPADAIHQEERAFQLGKLASVEWSLGDGSSSRRHAAEGAKIAGQLHQSDPASMERLYAYANQRFYELSFSAGPFQADQYSELIEQLRTLLLTDSPPTSWYALAAQVAATGANQSHPAAIDWGKDLLDSDVIVSALLDGEQHHLLGLATAITLHDPSRRQRVRGWMEEAETVFQLTGDFGLALPLLLAHRLLGEHDRAQEIMELMADKGCRHPQLLSLQRQH